MEVINFCQWLSYSNYEHIFLFLYFRCHWIKWIYHSIIYISIVDGLVKCFADLWTSIVTSLYSLVLERVHFKSRRQETSYQKRIQIYIVSTALETFTTLFCLQNDCNIITAKFHTWSNIMDKMSRTWYLVIRKICYMNVMKNNFKTRPSPV